MSLSCRCIALSLAQNADHPIEASIELPDHGIRVDIECNAISLPPQMVRASLTFDEILRRRTPVTRPCDRFFPARATSRALRKIAIEIIQS